LALITSIGFIMNLESRNTIDKDNETDDIYENYTDNESNSDWE